MEIRHGAEYRKVVLPIGPEWRADCEDQLAARVCAVNEVREPGKSAWAPVEPDNGESTFGVA